MSGFSTEPDINDMPVGFSMAMIKNVKAMNAFAGMDDEHKRQVIEEARGVQSDQEMDQLIEKIGTLPL